ncbi:tRNA preQ1(34) S-adenosylmethionine ribosyltransferase-isomerase QueA [Alkanindiges hydrocarboniclasticus]|uniref:S-adenosylmethionine:tRNA ribosyltransferase-isomerase n=1 Tax=Alkanindiges hydrocarboniclasticus TaxID=1907941 RepID=A0A1S8CTU0_9GAMM|nr:tRNA preQ1(34) S-adenosylmethionine ribosyltransferase-isomerase QueA [Alkanindiges hydrocarboniclasticus]ONG39587.1 tRNA preQ1(34) S-adenosylmethionine ribosyltransferase-isomerase QueA [Alkanindiges hydrocarboniclasticus]
MQLSDFSYDLPDELIARYPLATRSASRLLYLNAQGHTQDCTIKQLPELLQAGDLLVLNDTRVIKARLHGRRASGGAVEVLVERITGIDTALAHIKASNSPKAGTTLYLANDQLEAQVAGRQNNLYELRFNQPVLAALEQFGALPIPPYFNRAADETDDERYQTVFHNPDKAASVAAPTASLHFDDELLAALEQSGINKAFVTLHVGAGTFQPVRTDNIVEHVMHSEWGEVPQATVELIAKTKANGGKIIAVGTTATRALESAAKANHGELKAWSGETDIFIYPGYSFKVIDRLLTNFHLPESTLLMLVSALAGRDPVLKAYEHAIRQQYRFFSYGDAMLIDKKI